MDTVDRQTRSRIMASVGQKNTGAETLLRSALHKAGFRFRLHVPDLPGRPDIVLPKYKTAIFVHGCYWHSHGCYKSTKPKTRRAFWNAKFCANQERDARNLKQLREAGWRVLTVWECALMGKIAKPLTDITAAVDRWLASDRRVGQIGGRGT